ncbi:sterol desaturase family protein [Roseivirga sp. E12]|uniref:sterol desaturase family protein n=1 Tax=Roseivirga sp. E12 TaxID=2819237 RepID=UPI001ABC080B|nr:sterol desaturase family protein [Roseivirga sp. E12]MBO3697073.1 sterol desaturase family protein [Roseivirga sp. E12]
MSLNPTVIAIPVYFLLIGIELIVHRIKATKSYRLNDAITNINCGVTSQVTGAFLKVFSIGFYTYLYEHFRFETIENSALTWVIAFIAYDFFYYWAHRMSHQVNLFWGGHSVHHQSEEYNLSVALRQSSTQIIWTSLFYTPMAFVGIDPLVLLSVSGFNLLYQFWIHTESIDRLPKWFEAVMNTPSHHRVHHARNPKYIDKNHAGTFIVWDKMFGTFKAEEEKPTYGITKNLNSWNPVWANLAHYSDMISDIKTIPRFSDKLKYIFKKPGWLPESMGGYRAPFDIDRKTYKKYDLHAIRAVNTYVFVHYILLLGGTAFFLFNLNRFDENLLEKSAMAGLIIISTLSFGGLFESRSWAIPIEITRLFLVPITLLYFLTNFELSTFTISGSIAFIFGSLLWLLKTRSVTSQPVNNS